MLDSGGTSARQASTGGEGRVTLHEALLDNLTQTLHVGLGQVFALLGLLQPLVWACAFGEARRPRLGDVAVLGHGCGGEEKKEKEEEEVA
jgi:hypothetical protein